MDVDQKRLVLYVTESREPFFIFVVPSYLKDKSPWEVLFKSCHSSPLTLQIHFEFVHDPILPNWYEQKRLCPVKRSNVLPLMGKNLSRGEMFIVTWIQTPNSLVVGCLETTSGRQDIFPPTSHKCNCLSRAASPLISCLVLAAPNLYHSLLRFKEDGDPVTCLQWSFQMMTHLLQNIRPWKSLALELKQPISNQSVSVFVYFLFIDRWNNFFIL